jgi:small subunit ribosomal protein S9
LTDRPEDQPEGTESGPEQEATPPDASQEGAQPDASQEGAQPDTGQSEAPEPAPATPDQEPVAQAPAGDAEPPAAAQQPPAPEPEAPAAVEPPPAIEPEPAAAAEPPPAAEAEPPPATEPAAREERARERPAVPGADLEVDIVPEGVDPLARQEAEALYDEDLAPPQDEAEGEEAPAEEAAQPIVAAAIDLAADARYRATGKRKTAIARVILRPGAGNYTVNGRALDEHFPRPTLQRNIRQPLEAVGYDDQMDVVARLHGGGVSAQAGALRHGISRALLEADPNLRGELKRRGFLTRDARAKERKKAGLKKARKRPQFSKR